VGTGCLEPNNKKQWSAYLLVSTFVFETIGIIAIGYISGSYLDKWIHTDFVFTVVFMVLAVFYAIYHLIRQVNKQGDEDEPEL